MVMTKDEIDAGEVLKKLAELKRTLPEDEYQEIERQVLPRLAEHFGREPANKKSWVGTAIGWIVALAVLVILLALADRFPWLKYVWYAWVILWAVAIVLQFLAGILNWLKEATKPPGRY